MLRYIDKKTESTATLLASQTGIYGCYLSAVRSLYRLGAFFCG